MIKKNDPITAPTKWEPEKYVAQLYPRIKCVIPLNDMMSDKDMLKSEALSMSISVSRSDPNIDNKNCITKANDAIKAMHKIMSLPMSFCFYFVNNISHIFDGFNIIHLVIINKNTKLFF